MLRKNLPLIAGLGLVLVTSTGANADICFQYGTGGAPAVAKGAKLPAPNSCVPLALFEANEFGTRLGAANAMLCRDNDITLVYHYNYDACTGPGSYSESATCRLAIPNGDLPSASSNCNGQYTGLLPNQTGPAKQFSDFTLKAWYCDGKDVPGGGFSAQCLSRWGFSHPEMGEDTSKGAPERQGRGR
jgi:hypothetical protein